MQIKFVELTNTYYICVVEIVTKGKANRIDTLKGFYAIDRF